MARSGALSVPRVAPHPGDTKLRHFGVDPLDAVVADYRDPVVAVQDEVEAADLVEAHGRQLLTPVEGQVYALPPFFHARLSRQEVSVKLRTPADAASYLYYRHRPHASMDSPHCPGDLSDIIEAQQPIRSVASSQTSTDSPEQCLTAREAEVFIHLHFEVHVADHRRPFLRVSMARAPMDKTSDLHAGQWNTPPSSSRISGWPHSQGWAPRASGRPMMFSRVSSVEPSSGSPQESQRAKPWPNETSLPDSQNGQTM